VTLTSRWVTFITDLSDVAILGMGASAGVFILVLVCGFAFWRRRSSRVRQRKDVDNETRAGDMPMEGQSPQEAYGDSYHPDDPEEVPLPAFARA
jgi:HAMP domain-containing protein